MSEDEKMRVWTGSPWFVGGLCLIPGGMEGLPAWFFRLKNGDPIYSPRKPKATVCLAQIAGHMSFGGGILF